MTTALLVLIALMWLPVALLNLGKGEAKGTGAVTGIVGAVVVLGAIIQAAVFKDAFTAALVSTIYMLLFFTGGPVMADGSQLVGKSMYLAMACLGYAILTFEVWLAFHGKLGGGVVAWSLIIWVPVGLWIPAFWLMAAGELPF